MATECFVSGGRSRGPVDKPNQVYTKSTTYLRCSAIDCGRNAFNDVMCGTENTSVIECRIVDVGGCAWEGASRFVKFVGNYVRNAGTVAMGNLGPANHDNTFPELGAGQHIIANNVFESTVPYGGAAIRAAVGATQVLVTNNLFINFGSSAVNISGSSDLTHYATANATVSGNLFDMTEIGAASVPRIAIDISAADTIVADNQIYVRGACDPKVTALRLLEPALNANVHDNLIRNCGVGIQTGRGTSRVGEVIDPRTFVVAQRTIPLEPRSVSQCQGWQLVWLAAGKATERSVVEAITGAAATDKVKIVIKEPRAGLKAGDSFEIIPPAANWNLHDNTVADCLQPVILDSYGGEASGFRDNLVTRGATSGVTQAVQVRGRFQVIGNQFSGFDEAGSAVLGLHADPFRDTGRSLFQRNVFTRCTQVVAESRAGLWDAVGSTDNLFSDCGAVPKVPPAVRQAAPAMAAVPIAVSSSRPAFVAGRAVGARAVDGAVDEWPWQESARVIAIAEVAAGAAASPVPGRACAAWDDQFLYLAIRIAVAPGVKLRGGTEFAACDGVEVSLQGSSGTVGNPIFVLWGSSDASWQALPAGGASPQQCKALRDAVVYAARVSADEWTCEWRIPFAALQLDPAQVSRVGFNIGLHVAATDAWVAWRATGGAFYEVGNAGELVLSR
jgi:hypothetical protein